MMNKKVMEFCRAQDGFVSAMAMILVGLLVTMVSASVYINSKNFAMNKASGDAAAAEMAAVAGVRHLEAYLGFKNLCGSAAVSWFHNISSLNGTLTADAADNNNWSSAYIVTWNTAGATSSNNKYWYYNVSSNGTYNGVTRTANAVIAIKKSMVDMGHDIIALTPGAAASKNNPSGGSTTLDKWSVTGSGATGSATFDSPDQIWLKFSDTLNMNTISSNSSDFLDVAYDLQINNVYNNGQVVQTSTGGYTFGMYYLMSGALGNTNTTAGASGYVVQYDPGLNYSYNSGVGSYKTSTGSTAQCTKGFMIVRKSSSASNLTSNNDLPNNGSTTTFNDAYGFENNNGYNYSTNTNVPWYNNIVDISTAENVFESTYSSTYDAVDVVQVPFEQVGPLLQYAYAQSGGAIGVQTFSVNDNHSMEVKVKRNGAGKDVTAVYLDGVLVLRYIDRSSSPYTSGGSGLRLSHMKATATNYSVNQLPYIYQWKNN